MNNCNQKVYWVILLSFCNCVFTETISTSKEVSSETKDELSVAEAKDRLDIIKTIKKINNDGSYTIGYEADDGSFKIESRDVLGNIKGTYGYVDEGGEVKRVSYTSRNISDLIAEAPSVVQRIPKTNDKSSTKSPSVLLYNPTTVPTQTSATKRIITTTSPTTVSGPTRFIHFPQRSLLKTTSPPQVVEVQKSEGQIIRPEISTARPTDLPLKKHHDERIVENEKPVTEESEVKESNLLRRQLPPEFDPRQHVAHFQQSLGEDSVDVYSGSHTARPLFTTTLRPRTSSIPYVEIKPNKLHSTTEKPIKENVIGEGTSPEPSPAQAPSNFYQVEQTPSQFVAVRHPYHSGIVLMPYNQIQVQPQYFVPNPLYRQQAVPNPTQYPENPQTATPVYIQRPPLLRSIPVHINDNDYVEHVRANVHQIHHAASRNGIGEVSQEVDTITPPVSTRDFQKIIQLLILRQTRLEQANALLFAQLNNRPTPTPEFFIQRPITVAPQHTEHPRYIVRSPQHNSHQDPSIEYSQTVSSYTPTRRVARLLRSKSPADDEQNVDENVDYLPPQIREMLLLRMLQLAINPALPVQSQTLEESEASTPQPNFIKKTGIRNVEVLGEEEDEDESRGVNRNKRYKNRY